MKEFYKNKKILVTGGAGFIGSHIVDELVKLKAKVIVLDDLSYGKETNISHHGKKIKFIKGSINNKIKLSEALNGVDIINHQAALRSVPKSVEEPLKYHSVNVDGTIRLFHEAKKRNISRIVFASSSAVYGERKTFPEKETDKPEPVSPYAMTKLICEQYALLFSRLYNMEIVALRYFNVFGPGQSLENQYGLVVPKFINCLLKNKEVPIYGDGTQERDFCYIANIVSANINAMSLKSISGGIFNVAEGRAVTVNYLLKALENKLSKKARRKTFPKRKGDVSKTLADISKLKRKLKNYKHVNFEKGLELTAEWFSTRGK
ncbi:MAG: NAD-dependent epimerase/dehydratase family protein [Candidatus Omnitrophica bacterium]|nr:NAD-dependent epimerase/dehydratase family protein [Candidatus Omnitrophota bacterium]MDD5441009.1 NAD-dependent epimerase/dehydratase family protein [Candidatus Omnitrophota bacterium]